MFITVQFDERTNVPKAKGKIYISSYERGQQDNISAKSKNEQKAFLTYPRKLDLVSFKVEIISDTEFLARHPITGKLASLRTVSSRLLMVKISSPVIVAHPQVRLTVLCLSALVFLLTFRRSPSVIRSSISI